MQTITLLENTRATNFSSNMTENKTFLTCPGIFTKKSNFKSISSLISYLGNKGNNSHRCKNLSMGKSDFPTYIFDVLMVQFA